MLLWWWHQFLLLWHWLTCVVNLNWRGRRKFWAAWHTNRVTIIDNLMIDVPINFLFKSRRFIILILRFSSHGRSKRLLSLICISLRHLWLLSIAWKSLSIKSSNLHFPILLFILAAVIIRFHNIDDVIKGMRQLKSTLF